MASPNGTVVRLVLRFVAPRELGCASSVNNAWRTSADTQWTQTVNRPKGHINLLLSAGRQRQHLGRCRDACADREWAYRRGLEKCSKTGAPVGISFLGLLAAAILGVVDADGRMGWPCWLVPLPMAICGAPLVLRLFMSGCVLLPRCYLWCATWRVRRTLLPGPLLSNRAEFDNMVAALESSNSLVVQLQQAHHEVELPSVLFAQPLQQSLNISPVEALIVAVWASAMLSLMLLPALLRFAPLYCACIGISLFPRAVLDKDFVPMRLALLSSAALTVSIFLLCLQLDGVLHSPVAVSVSFWVFLALAGLCGCLTVYEAGDEWPDEERDRLCILLCCSVGMAIALASAAVGIAALLEKTIGGVLAVIPYTVIVFVLLACVPVLCFWCSFCVVLVSTLDSD